MIEVIQGNDADSIAAWEWLSTRGYFPQFVRDYPSKPGVVLYRSRQTIGARTTYIPGYSYYFHESDRALAVLFKLTWGVSEQKKAHG
jgi:hypothetical protein